MNFSPRSGCRANTADSRPLEIVLHVPKCAGSTIRSHLQKNLAPGEFWTPPRRTIGFPQEQLGRKYSMRNAPPFEHVRAVSSHYVGQSVKRFFPGRQARCCVLLRRPNAQMISWYNFRMMRYLSAGKPAYPFALHLKTLPPDPVAHFILSNWLEIPWARLATMSASEKHRRICAAFEDLDFIGDIKDCDALLADLCSRLGIASTGDAVNTSEDWRSWTGWRLLRLNDLDAATRALLHERTRLDQAVYASLVGDPRDSADAEGAASMLLNEPRRFVADIRRRLLPRPAASRQAA